MTQLREHLKAPVDEARIERQWRAIHERGLPTGTRGGRSWLWAFAGAATMAALGLLIIALYSRQATLAPAPQAALPPPLAPVAPGAVLEGDAREVAVQLSDGSRVALAPRARVRVRSNLPKVVELELAGGRARFDVTHDRARTFAVRIGDAEVRVLGTRFELEHEARAEGTFVSVSVSEGVVEVRRADEVARIHAGERWSATFPRHAAKPPADEPAIEAELAPEQPAAPAKARAPREPDAEPAASELFGQATLARRAGRMREAADSYGALLARFPQDTRASLAAFELGRLRMDALNDQAGAIEALERSLRAGAAASFREDALARIVVASDALGRTEQCLRARARYTEHYPRGVHASALAQRCK